MDVEDMGRTTLYTRVEAWECDYNNHWNVRYYARSFQLAAEAIATAPGAASPGAAQVQLRHMRFHRELFVSAPVKIRSARVADGPHQGATVHLLQSDGRLAASAVDLSAREGADIPLASAQDLAIALPRSVAETEPAVAIEGWAEPVPMGPIRPVECDHTGALLWEEMIRRLALTSHEHMTNLGFTRDFVQQSGINRMSAEMRIERQGEVPVGTCVRGTSRLVAVGRKSFSTEHRVESDTGTPLAFIRQNLLAVDLKTRRAVEVPAFLRAFSG